MPLISSFTSYHHLISCVRTFHHWRNHHHVYKHHITFFPYFKNKSVTWPSEYSHCNKGRCQNFAITTSGIPDLEEEHSGNFDAPSMYQLMGLFAVVLIFNNSFRPTSSFSTPPLHLPIDICYARFTSMSGDWWIYLWYSSSCVDTYLSSLFTQGYCRLRMRYIRAEFCVLFCSDIQTLVALVPCSWFVILILRVWRNERKADEEKRRTSGLESFFSWILFCCPWN